MKLKTLHLKQAPGIDDAFHLHEIGSGMVVIHGPNGIGKTTICRAVGQILWSSEKTGWQIEALWHDEAGELRVESRDGNSFWRRGVNEVTLAKPPAHLQSCCTLRIDEMLAPNANSSEITEEFLKIMNGGYSLHKVYGDKRFAFSKPSVLLNSLASAEHSVHSAQGKQKDLQKREQEELPKLKARQQEAKRLRDELSFLQQTKKLADDRAKQAEVLQRKELMSPCLEQFRAGDDVLCRSIEQQRTDYVSKRDQAQSAIHQAEINIRVCNLAENQPIPSAVLTAWQERPREIQQLQHEIDKHKETVQIAKAKSDCALEALAQSPNITVVPDFSAKAIQEAKTLLLRTFQDKTKMTGYETALGLLKSDYHGEGAEIVAEKLDGLTEWLTMPDLSNPMSQPNSLVLPIILAIIVLVSLALAITKLPWCWITVLCGVIGLSLAYSDRQNISKRATENEIKSSELQDRRKKLQLRLDQSHQSVEQVWDRASVEKWRRELLRELKFALLAEQQAERCKAIMIDAENCRRSLAESDLEQQRLEKITGFGLSWPNFDKVWFLDNLLAYRTALAEWQTATESLKGCLVKAQDIFEIMHKEFTEYDRIRRSIASDLIGVNTRVQDLNHRSASLTQAIKDRNAAEHELQASEQGLQEANANLETFLNERDLQTAQEFHELWKQWPDWEKWIRDASILFQSISRAEDDLKNHPDLLSLPLVDLQNRIISAQAAQDDYDNLEGQIQRIQTEVEHAKSKFDLTEAMTQEADSRRKIQDKREEARIALAGKFLLDRVRNRNTGLPAVFERADKLFSMFTQGAYHLRFSAPTTEARSQADSFHAYEVETHWDKKLSELSAGTRVQLQIAARVAFAEHAAEGQQFPLFLDEALKHSDPLRYREALNCLKQLVSAGRQLFYFTNEPTEVQRFRDAFSEDGVLHCIDLAAIRQRTTAHAAEAGYEVPIIAAIPPPTPDESVESYAFRIAVPKFDPRQPVESMSLFYTLGGDNHALHALLSAGAGNVRQWRHIRQTLLDKKEVSEELAAEIDNAICAAECFLRLWAIGKGQPLTRDVLTKAGVSNSFIDRAWEACEKASCDARETIRSLETLKGYGANKAAPIADWLIANGFLSEEEPLCFNDLISEAQNDLRLAHLPSDIIARHSTRYWHYANVG